MDNYSKLKTKCLIYCTDSGISYEREIEISKLNSNSPIGFSFGSLGLLMNKPIISLISALDKNRGIGKDNKIPWHINEDIEHFRQMTRCLNENGKNNISALCTINASF